MLLVLLGCSLLLLLLQLLLVQRRGEGTAMELLARRLKRVSFHSARWRI